MEVRCDRIDPKTGEVCGSKDVKIIVDGRLSIVYHCNKCRFNFIVMKDKDNVNG